MRYWTGLALFAIAAWLLRSGLAHRRRVLEARRLAPPRALHPSLAAVADVLPPFAWLVLAFTGAKSALAYAAFDAGRVFSITDLAGFLSLLAGFGAWLTLRARHHGVLDDARGGRTADVRRLARADRDAAGVRGRAGAGRPGALVGARDEAA